MSATSKKSAKRMKRRAKKLAKSKAAEEAKQRALDLTAKKNAGDVLRADELADTAGDIASSLMSGLKAEADAEGGDLAQDTDPVMEGLKSTFGSDFAAKRALLASHMGDGDHDGGDVVRKTPCLQPLLHENDDD